MKLKLLLFMLLCSTVAYSQMQGEKGSLLLKNNQVLTGKVTFFYDDPGNIILHSHQDIKETFTPNQVAEIRLENGEKFVAKPYRREGNAIMLQVLLESSKISLFRREDDGSVYYYVSKDTTLQRLENNEIIVEKGSRTYTKHDHKYIGILSYLMPDRMDLVKKLDNLELTEQELTEVILEYDKGDVSYYWKSDNQKAEKEPNWVTFIQYSRFGSIIGLPTSGASSGKMIGLQYYFSKHSRSSLKVSLDYSSYMLDDEEELQIKGLGVRYLHDIKKAEKYGFYLLLHVADVAQLTFIDEAQATATKQEFMFLPRLSPGLGFEAKPLPRMAVYAELNHLLNLQGIWKSFSFGLKYGLGRTGW